MSYLFSLKKLMLIYKLKHYLVAFYITITLCSVISNPIDPTKKSTSDYQVTIDGTVMGDQYSNLLDDTDVKVRDLSGNVLDTDITNENGEFLVTYLETGTNEQVKGKVNENAYPNPYKNNVTLEFAVSNPENYTLSVTNADGRLVYEQNILLFKGNNKINLEGGNKGLHVITLQNEENKTTYKAVQTENTGRPFTAEVESIASYFKSSALNPDSVILSFIKPGYDTLEVKLASENQTYNAVMQQLKDTVNFTLKVFTETGESPLIYNPTFHVDIERDGVTHTFSGDVLNVNFEVYRQPDGSLGTALINNDTTDLDGDGYWFQNWTLGRYFLQPTNQDNLYQNNSSQLIPEYQTTTTLDSLDGKIIYHYVIKNKAETQPGVFENLNSLFTRGLITSSGNGLSGMYVDLKPFNVADTFDICVEDFNMSTNQPMPEWQMDRVNTTLDSLLDTKHPQNGDAFLTTYRVYTISSTEDPRYLALVDRSFENSVVIAFYDGPPGNARFWESNFTYNGHLRLKNAYAIFNENSPNSVILSEMLSALTGETEGTGNLAEYVSTIAGLPTKYCESISTIPVLLNLGTGDSKDGGKQPKLKEGETLGVITFHNPDGTTTRKTEITSNYDFFQTVQEASSRR